METKRRLIPVVLAWALTFLGLPAPDEADELEFIEPQVERVMQEWQAPGAIVVVLSQGEVVHARGYGVADLATGEPVDVDSTVFRLASISKPVTASAALELYQQDRLDLDAELHRYLGTFRVGGARTLTMAHLLTHTAGFEDRFLTRLARDPFELPPLERYLAEQMPERAYEPGEISLYSNHGMALAGLVIEKISGRPFASAMEELVFEPLEMHSTSFELESLSGRLAQGYRFGEPVPLFGIKTVPASMLVSTGSDMARWMKALLRPEGSGFLEAETVELMLARHFAHHPSFTGRAYGFSEDASVAPRRLLHSGAMDGFSAGIVLVPERAGGVLVAFNGNAYVWELIREILDRLFPAEPAPWSPVSFAAGAETPEQINGATGRYVPAELPRGSFDEVRLLFEQVPLASAGTGALLYRDRRFDSRGGGVFQEEDGSVMVLRQSAGGRWLLLEEGNAWVRIPWHRHWQVNLVALLLLVAALILLIVGWPSLPSRSLSRRVLRIAAALEVLFLCGMGVLIGIAMSRDGGVLRFEIPWYLFVLLSLPLIALVCSVVAVWLYLREVRPGPGRVRSHASFVAAIVTIAVFSGYLAHWHWLGFHL